METRHTSISVTGLQMELNFHNSYKSLGSQKATTKISNWPFKQNSIQPVKHFQFEDFMKDYEVNRLHYNSTRLDYACIGSIC